jgi:hypothetical protein
MGNECFVGDQVFKENIKCDACKIKADGPIHPPE